MTIRVRDPSDFRRRAGRGLACASSEPAAVTGPPPGPGGAARLPGPLSVTVTVTVGGLQAAGPGRPSPLGRKGRKGSLVGQAGRPGVSGTQTRTMPVAGICDGIRVSQPGRGPLDLKIPYATLFFHVPTVPGRDTTRKGHDF